MKCYWQRYLHSAKVSPHRQHANFIDKHTITSQEIDGETVETVADFIFLGSKITADGDCSHEIRRRLLLRRKAMTSLDSVFKKQR